jgi:hypothetical protein
MDYEVFLLTAFREHWERSGDMVVAVRRGLADTGRLVTAAALIMVTVFGSFILSDNAIVKMFGVGLATAVAVDATIVRCLLVPAIMVLAQKGTWWLPGWLDRLIPQLHVEGDPRALDAAAANAAQRVTVRSPLAWYRPGAVLGAFLGMVTAWALVSRLPQVQDALSPAVAMSAVLGAVLALLPNTLNRANRWARAFSYTLGAGLALGVATVITAMIPLAEQSSTPITAWAIVASALLAVVAVGRSIALPMVLGAVAMAVAQMLDTTGGVGTLVTACVLPALVTMVVISVFDALFPLRPETMETGRPSEPEPIQVGRP